MSSLWLMFGALAAFAVAYRYYGAFLAAKVAVLDDRRETPSHRLEDGVDYSPTNQWVLFGVHFAAIAGPGPLVGPVLAAQWGYFPGFVWIVVGACLAGAVHDFVILWASVREDGLSLSKLARRSIGPVSGNTATLAALFIIVVTLAAVATVVVNALAHSPWGMFTILVTIPAALLTGFWMYKLRPGKVAEASVIGVSLVLLGVFLGRPFAESTWGASLIFDKQTLSLILPAYAALASILPVWVLMCPRDYLSSYMKIGVIVVLGAGIFAAHPVLKMPAMTPFIHGGGPVISGPLWPFLCIVIMCGAISGFHSLISSGTTPKMLDRERHIRTIGYGAMLVEGVVALTALIAACALEPGDYFAINATPAAYQQLQSEQLARGWNLAPVELAALETGTQEKLAGRVGGAVTLAVGMAKVFAALPYMSTLTSYWYHFVIMFEALFILTLLETGTRVARFMFQEAFAEWLGAEGAGEARRQSLVARIFASEKGKPNWLSNVGLSGGVCFLWGYLLYRGDLDTLWRMLGIVNQLLASIALAVGTTYILLHSPRRIYALCTVIPFVFLVVTTFTASVMSIQSWWGQIGTLQATIAAGALPAAELAAADKQAFLLKLVCLLAGIMLCLVGVIVVDAVRRWWTILRTAAPPAPDGDALALRHAAP